MQMSLACSVSKSCAWHKELLEYHRRENGQHTTQSEAHFPANLFVHKVKTIQHITKSTNSLLIVNWESTRQKAEKQMTDKNLDCFSHWTWTFTSDGKGASSDS